MTLVDPANAAPATPNAATERVLIIDDSLIARRMMRATIARLYPDADVFEAEEADSGEDAWRSAQPDLTVIDHTMPGRTGLELAAQLRAEAPAAEIILCTANIQDAIRQRAAEIGVAVINKPVSCDLLAAARDIAEARACA